jgi:hypothetical protein
MQLDVPHRADIADRDLLEEISAACQWWRRQRTWLVSSSFTGGGVIEAFEHLVAGRVAAGALGLALPSGTAALVTALRAAGIRPGATIGVPALGWTAAGAAASALCVRTRALPVNQVTGLLDPALLASDPGLAGGLAAVVAVHQHGIACDVPELRRVWPGIPVIEDAAWAWGACYPDGAAVGSAADACAFSFDAAKTPSAGELGCLVTRTHAWHARAVELTQHPVRQMVAGVPSPKDDQPMMRVAPAVAMLGAFAVQRHAAQAPMLRQAAARLASDLEGAGLTVLPAAESRSPGIIAVKASLTQVRAAVDCLTLTGGLTVASVRQPKSRVHPQAAGEAGLLKLAGSTVTVTLASRRRKRTHQAEYRKHG